MQVIAIRFKLILEKYCSTSSMGYEIAGRLSCTYLDIYQVLFTVSHVVHTIFVSIIL